MGDPGREASWVSLGGILFMFAFVYAKLMVSTNSHMIVIKSQIPQPIYSSSVKADGFQDSLPLSVLAKLLGFRVSQKSCLLSFILHPPHARL